MKFILMELVWAILIMTVCLLLLPAINLVDWSEVYLSVWYGLKKMFPLGSDGTVRLIVFVFAALSFLLLIATAISILRKIPAAALRVRLIQFVILLSVFFVAEIYLQWQGLFPGSVFRNFKIVDELKEQEFQYSDSSGIIRYIDNPVYFPSDYVINKAGFRSKYEYDSLSITRLKKQGKKVFMFIGDSFVAGLSAQPIANCFVDLFDSGSIVSLNFGQLGADPVQYALVCSTYVSKVKPDKVFVCIYENDFLTYEREPSPGIPIYYRTNTSPNGGMMLSQKPLEFGFAANELFKSPQEAYDFYVEHYTVRKNENVVTRFFSYSSLLTQFYLKLSGFDTVQGKRSVTGSIDDLNVQVILFRSLKEIKRVCDEENIPVMFCGIPSASQEETEPVVTLKEGSDSVEIFYPSNFSKKDFNTSQGDIHFNNEGHRKYFGFLQQKLRYWHKKPTQ